MHTSCIEEYVVECNKYTNIMQLNLVSCKWRLRKFLCTTI